MSAHEIDLVGMAVQQGANLSSAASPRVLVVESDTQTAAMARRCLERAGYTVEVTTSASQTLRWLQTWPPDLVVLDPRLPGEQRLSFERLRTCTDVPVVMISPLADEHERTWGLQLGADDYVPSPLCAEELVARVGSVLRRARPAPDRPTEGAAPAAVVLDSAGRRVRVAGAWVALTSLEFRLLSFLTCHPGQAFRREELLEAVWGYAIGDQSTVTVHVRRLREKIEPDPAHPVFIVTLWGVGYRFDPSGGRGDPA